jgi:hypothetical protein
MPRAPFLVAVALSIVGFSGCLTGSPGDLGADPPGPWQDTSLPPSIAIPDPIRGIEHVRQAVDPTGKQAGTSGGMDVYGHYAYVPGQKLGFWVVDVQDPGNARIVGSLGPNLDTNNSAILVRFVTVVDLDGRIIAVGAGQGSGMHFIDVTIPETPILLTTLNMPDVQPVHNVIKIPGTSLVYNTPSTGKGGINHIVDLADPEDPVVVGSFGDHGCHLTDIRVDLNRAYCAGVQETQIWDITDPRAPVLVSRIDSPLIALNDQRLPALPVLPPQVPPLPPPAPSYGYPVRLYGLHHQAYPSEDGKILLVTDEHAGGGEPGGCFVSQRDPVTGATVSTPIGAVWFFDISNEKAPALLSWFSPPSVAPKYNTDTSPPTVTPFPNCTAHIGTLVPGRAQTLIGWYHSGLTLVDFSNPTEPYMVTRWNDGTNTWNTKIHEGWILTGDIARGLDVLKFV